MQPGQLLVLDLPHEVSIDEGTLGQVHPIVHPLPDLRARNLGGGRVFHQVVDGGRAVANALADLEERVSRPLVLVVGMLATKDCENFLKNFTGLARRIVAVPIPHQEKSLAAGAIVDVARGVGIPAQSETDVATALAAIGRFALDPPARILITGSLYLAGEVLKQNGTLPT